MKKEILSWFLELYLGIVLIAVNIFFLLFVHNKHDLSPNFALAVITLPFAFYKIYKQMKNDPKKNKGDKIK